MTDYLKDPVDFARSETAAMFEQLAPWMLRFGNLLLDHVPIRRGQSVLDLGCGTGFPVLELASIHGAGARLVAIDLWPAAIDRARAKAKLLGLQNVEIVEADAAQMPFGDSEFDLIVSNLGLNNFDRAADVVRECYRVAKAGARLAITTNIIGHMREFYAIYREVLADFSDRDALDRLRRNEEHRGTRDSVSQLLEHRGFIVTKAIEEEFALRYADASALFHHPLIQFGFMEGWREIAGAENEQQVFRALERRLNVLASERGEIALTIPMLYLEARRP
jgi:arsenite methyltransferase